MAYLLSLMNKDCEIKKLSNAHLGALMMSVEEIHLRKDPPIIVIVNTSILFFGIYSMY